MDYNLFQADKKDVDILIKNKLNNIFEYAIDLSYEEIEKINNYVKNKIPKQLSNYKIIVKDNEIIGCVLVEKYKDGYLLDEIYIEKEFRNIGIGSDVMRNILKDKEIVYLWVYKNNVMALKLYLKFGFCIEQETETRYFMKWSIV